MNHVVESYENYKEEDRLTSNNARKIEFVTTVRALDTLIKSTDKILDCAAGTGVYPFYYAEKGCHVTALDITPRHIHIINNKLENSDYDMKAAVNDATDLSQFEADTFDVVLCMGPIYHLIDESMRIKCLSECNRVLKKGGILAVAYINKLFVFPFVATGDTKYLNMELAQSLVKTGIIRQGEPNCFWTDCYFTTPEEMETEIKNQNLQVIDHISTDGITPFVGEKVDLMGVEQFKVWCEYHYSVCREKSIMGISNHGLIIGRKEL